MEPFHRGRFALVSAALIAILLGGAGGMLGVCGPFTDFSDASFCPFVLEIFYLGITTGTSPTTYDPAASVSRLQMAAFLSRSVDGVLRRGSRRAALRQFSTPAVGDFLGSTTIPTTPFSVECDGTDVWVTGSANGGSVSRVRGSDGTLLQTWTGSLDGSGILVALGRIFVVGATTPGRLYSIDPSLPPGAVTTVANNLGAASQTITFDGVHIWSANGVGTISLVAPGSAIPWTTTTVTVGTALVGSLYDGANVWMTDFGAANLLKFDSGGAVLQTVTTGQHPGLPAYDGTNIWVPNQMSNTVSVVRSSNGALLATLTGNGLNAPTAAAFDGQRVLITNQASGANSVSLWKAADLSTVGSFSTGSGSGPSGAASDGVNFWVVLGGLSKVARF